MLALYNAALAFFVIVLIGFAVLIAALLVDDVIRKMGGL
jgi:hypothetical protein